MSYCALIPFKDGKPQAEIEFRNSWGGAARIWDALFNRYLKNPGIPYHTWLTDKGNSLWPLAKRNDLPMFERAVHASTFDYAYICHNHFKQFAKDLRRFRSQYPVVGNIVDHLGKWAEVIESSDAEAMGFYGTSVSGNPWIKYDPDTDESTPRPLSEGFEVYDWLDELNREPLSVLT